MCVCVRARAPADAGYYYQVLQVESPLEVASHPPGGGGDVELTRLLGDTSPLNNPKAVSPGPGRGRRGRGRGKGRAQAVDSDLSSTHVSISLGDSEDSGDEGSQEGDAVQGAKPRTFFHHVLAVAVEEPWWCVGGGWGGDL